MRWIAHYINKLSISSDSCKWSWLPSIPITEIELHLDNGKIIHFKGFEKYIIIKTEYQFVQGAKGTQFDTLNILCKKGQKVAQISVHRKGKVMQCQNVWGAEWRPLKIKTLPKVKKKDKKKFMIEFAEPQKTPHHLWKSGVVLKQAEVFID